MKLFPRGRGAALSFCSFILVGGLACSGGGGGGGGAPQNPPPVTPDDGPEDPQPSSSPAPTSLAVFSPAGPFFEGEDISVRAELSAGNQGVRGGVITVSGDAQGVGTTGADGDLVFRARFAPGKRRLNFAFGGDDQFAASSAFIELDIQARGRSMEATSLEFSVLQAPPYFENLPIGFQGRLLDSQGQPIPGKSLSLTGVGVPSQTTDAAGRIAFSAPFPAGPRRITVSFAGDALYQPSSRSLDLDIQRPGKVLTRLDAVAVGGGFIEDQDANFAITLTNEQGQPVPGKTVQISGAASGSVQTDASGKASFAARLPAGTQSLDFRFSEDATHNGSSDRVTITVAPAKRTSLISISFSEQPARVNRAVEIRVMATARRSGGPSEPLRRVELELLVDGQAFQSGQTDDNGLLAVSFTPSDRRDYQVIARYAGDQTNEPAEAREDLKVDQSVGVIDDGVPGTDIFELASSALVGKSPEAFRDEGRKDRLERIGLRLPDASFGIAPGVVLTGLTVTPTSNPDLFTVNWQFDLRPLDRVTREQMEDLARSKKVKDIPYDLLALGSPTAGAEALSLQNTGSAGGVSLVMTLRRADLFRPLNFRLRRVVIVRETNVLKINASLSSLARRLDASLGFSLFGSQSKSQVSTALASEVTNLGIRVTAIGNVDFQSILDRILDKLFKVKNSAKAPSSASDGEDLQLRLSFLNSTVDYKIRFRAVTSASGADADRVIEVVEESFTAAVSELEEALAVSPNVSWQRNRKKDPTAFFIHSGVLLGKLGANKEVEAVFDNQRFRNMGKLDFALPSENGQLFATLPEDSFWSIKRVEQGSLTRDDRCVLLWRYRHSSGRFSYFKMRVYDGEKLLTIPVFQDPSDFNNNSGSLGGTGAPKMVP